MKVDAKVLHFYEICKFHSRKMKKNLLFSALGIGRKVRMDARRIDASGSAEPMRDQIPMKWTEKERRLPNAGNCQEEKARWHPAEWKKGTESKDSISGKDVQDFLLFNASEPAF